MDPIIEAALRKARISLKMWSMDTSYIDDIIGPMSEEDRVKARNGAGASLYDDVGATYGDSED